MKKLVAFNFKGRIVGAMNEAIILSINKEKIMFTTRKYTKREVIEPIANYFEPLGIVDPKGRDCGFHLIAEKAKYTEKEAGEHYGYGVPAGAYYECRIQATRNGKEFGARQNHKRFSTEEEMWKDVTKRTNRMSDYLKKKFA